jgi:phosphate transport system permease protein
MTIAAREKFDHIFKHVFRTTGLLTIAILAGIFFMLIYNSVAFFLHSSPLDFITRTQWSPESSKAAQYGILPLLISTCFVTVGAMCIAIPLGIGAAAFISEYADKRLQNILKPVIEVMASVPSVAIGFLGLVIVGPAIAKIFGLQNGLDALNGSILLAIMSLPTIITIAEDAIHAVPQTFREASYAVGANKWETLVKVTIPAAAPGLIAAIMLGIGRAIGETMTVLMATGNAAAIPTNFFDSIRTITATIAIEMGEVPYQTTHYYALFAIAAVLFIITLAVNMIGESLANRLRKFNVS